MSSLTTAPLWIAGMLLVACTTVFAMAGTILIRRYVPLERLRPNNEVAGFKFATVGTLYAVLLAFAVLVVWEKYNEAESEVALEAGAAATIYRLSFGLAPDAGAALREAMTVYLDAAITEDWPAMAQGGESPSAVAALDDLYATLLRFEPVDQRGGAVMAESLGQLDLLTQARRSRVVAASGVVPDILWIVLFFGAFVTIGFTFFFGSENLHAQALMTGALSTLIFLGLLVIIAIDRPFAGTVKVTVEPLEAVVADFRGEDRP